MAFRIKTITVAANTGYNIRLSEKDSDLGFTNLKIRSTVAAFVQPLPYQSSDPYDSLATPTDPTPAAGQSTSYYLLTANEAVTLGYESPKGGEKNGEFVDRFQFVQIFAKAAGTIVMFCH